MTAKSQTIDPVRIDVNIIDEEDAYNDVEIIFYSHNMISTIELSEAQLSELAYKAANILQEIAIQRSAAHGITAD